MAELFPRAAPQQVYSLYDRDPYAGFAGLEAFEQQHPNFQTQRVVPSRGLPQIERSAGAHRAEPA